MRLFPEMCEVRFPDRQYEVIRAGDTLAVRVDPGPAQAGADGLAAEDSRRGPNPMHTD